MTQDSQVPLVTQLITAPGSRLEELHAGYEPAKAAFEDAKARYEALTSALKNEIAAVAPPGSSDVVLNGPSGLPRLRMKWLAPYRFDVKRFRAEHPALYVRYEVQGGHYELRQE